MRGGGSDHHAEIRGTVAATGEDPLFGVLRDGRHLFQHGQTLRQQCGLPLAQATHLAGATKCRAQICGSATARLALQRDGMSLQGEGGDLVQIQN